MSDNEGKNMWTSALAFVCNMYVMVNLYSKLCFQWVSNPVTDMYADSVVTVILRAERDPMPQKGKCV